MIRRTLIVVSMIFVLWAAPASAQSYGDVAGQDNGAGRIVRNASAPSGGAVNAGSAGGGGLARTGANNVTPLVQSAVVLIGGGALLILVARRRHMARRLAA